MRNLILNILLLIIAIPLSGNAQTASFCIDTLDHKHRNSGFEKGVIDEIKEMEWVIKGKYLNYKIGKIEVAISANKLDTIFYKERADSKWDTIICMIQKAKEYKFVYNHCCGGFYIADKNGLFFTSQIIFKIKDISSKNLYLGTIGETGMLIPMQNKDTLKPECRSPLFSNICNVKFSEIEICKDTMNCPEELYCLQEKGKSPELYNNLLYKTISNKLNLFYMPLSNNPIIIIYDPKTDQISIEGT